MFSLICLGVKFKYLIMNNNTRFELSFKNITQLENKLNFCKLNNIKNINIPCKGLIKKELFNYTINYISKNFMNLMLPITIVFIINTQKIKLNHIRIF